MQHFADLPEISIPPVPAGAATLRNAMSVLRRHAPLIAIVAGAVTMAVAAVVLALVPAYTATASISVRPDLADPLTPTAAAQQRQDDGAVETQVDLLRSRSIARQVVANLDIGTEMPTRSPLAQAMCDAIESFQPCAPLAAPTLNGRAEAFLQRLVIAPNGRSRVLDVTYTDKDPQVAAKAANMLVELAQKKQVADQAGDLQRTTAWLDGRAAELRDKLSAAEVKAGKFRASSGLNERTVNNASTPLVTDQIASASTDYSQAQAQLAAAEARSAAMSGAGRGDAQSMVRLTDQPLVVAAATNLSTLMSQRALLSQNYGDRYPPLVALNNQIADAQRKLSAETSRAVGAVNQDLAAKREEVTRLGRNLAGLRTQGNSLNAPLVQLRGLDRDVASASTIYQTFFERAREVADRTALLQPNIQVVSRAEPPDGPSFPRTSRFLLAGLVFGLVSGTGAAFAREYLSQGVWVSGQSSRQFALPLLTSVPAVPMHKRLRVSLARYVAQHPFSPAAESIRSLAAQLTLAGGSADHLGSVVITSATVEEGKSTICLWLGQAVAASGQRALIIDGDHRNGSLHRTMQRKNGAGLTDWVTGQATFDSVVQIDEAGGLDFMPSGAPMSRPFSQAELSRLRSMLTRIKQVYGVVIIDAPPVLAMSEPLLYASLVDHTVLVCRWERTSRAAVITCIDKLRAAGATLTGLVLSMVDPAAPDRFGEGVTKRDVKLLQRYYAD